MNTEQKIMLYGSLLNPTEVQRNFICTAVDEYRVDWGLLLKYCTHNRVISIVYSNLEKLGLTRKMESSVNRIMNAYRERITKRNHALMKEVRSIWKMANERSIVLVPIKGVNLLPFLYKDFPFREFGDADLLIKEGSITEIARRKK